ncbi:MAG: glycosyltransferase family 4 protein [Anaerolineae bacterium]|nr:glycosyltransferase family 4 protein [Anaerolineae bacterium]
MASKACLVGAYQTKLEAIGRTDDIELTVIVPPVWNDPSGPVLLERAHTDHYHLLVDPLRFNGKFHRYTFPTLPRRLREIQPDILHMDEEPYNLATWLGVRRARKLGVKTLFFSWQNILRRYPPPFNIMEKQVLDWADYGIMGNQAAVDVWQAKGYTGPYRVIPQFGVDTALFRPKTPTPLFIPQERPFTIGAAGRRLVPEKGIDLLLRAAAQVPGSWQVRIAGDGPIRPKLESLAQDLGIADRVFFSGALPSAEIVPFLHKLDVLVLPSRTLSNWKEQFGRVLIEAMACEVPVIGSDSGEIPHVIGDAGLIFAEDDVAGLANHLRTLAADAAQRTRLGAAGRRRVNETYTQTQIAAQTVAVYRAMIGQ